MGEPAFLIAAAMLYARRHVIVSQGRRVDSRPGEKLTSPKLPEFTEERAAGRDIVELFSVDRGVTPVPER